MDHFGEMLSKTPTWVWIVLVLVIIHGKHAFKDRTTPLVKIAIPPVLFTAFSIFTLHEAFAPTGKVIGIFVLAWLAGIVAANTVFTSNPPRLADPQRKIFVQPGTPRVLILGMIIFLTRYALAYCLVFDPQMLTETLPELLLLGLTGACSGFFVGKLLSCLKLLSGRSTASEG
jgi:hypothetical protein